MIPEAPITLDDVVAATRRVVDAHPRKKNQECIHFTEDGTPVCVVGHVLVDLGITVEDCRREDGGVVQAAPDLSTVLPLENDAASFLDELQNRADFSEGTGLVGDRLTWRRAFLDQLNGTLSLTQ